MIKKRNKSNSINISKLNRTKKKNDNEQFNSKRKLINNKKLFNNNVEKDASNGKIITILNKIKSIEKKNPKNYQSSSSTNRKEIKKTNKTINREISLDKRSVSKKSNITINNNYYTIINNMNINELNCNDMNKFNNNINFLKINE